MGFSTAFRAVAHSPLGLVTVLIVGYLAGVASQPATVIQADVTEDSRREAFKAGGERLEPVLRDVAATLKRIELRVEHIDKSMTQGRK